MILVFLGILIAAIITTWVINYFIDADGFGAAIFTAVFAVFLLVDVVFLVDNVNVIAEGRVIDDKIVVYEQENVEIESEIDVLVKQYMTQEEKVMLEAAAGESSITLVQLYPDLKSNELVKRQMDIYVKNNNKIKKLKMKKLNIEKAKWLIYFG